MISIIFIHYSQNKDRAELAVRSLESLYQSVKHLPVEIIVVNNGGDKLVPPLMSMKTIEGKITTYIQNHSNLWYRARNQGIRLSTGDYIVTVDDDLMYKNGWVEECTKVLDNIDKHFVTPIGVDRKHKQERYYGEDVEIDGKTYRTNRMAGSNCWMMKRKDFDEIGEFPDHPIAGTAWSKLYLAKGYSVVVTEQFVEHLGVRKTPYKGYSKTQGNWPKIKRTFLNGEEEILWS